MAINGKKLKGDGGDNILTGGGKRDRLEGLGGNDQLLGKGDKDRLFGGDGNDILNGGSGGDKLFGDDGADRIKGGKGNDRLFGGNGNDYLVGGNGDDYIDPGLSLGNGDVVVGGKGDDTIDFSAGGLAYKLDYSKLDKNLVIKLKGATGTVDKGSSGMDSILGLESINGSAGLTVAGGSGNDLIKSGLGAGQFVRLMGGEGKDELVGGASYDQLNFQGVGSTGISLKVTGYNKGAMKGKATDAFGDKDTFRKIDEIRGTNNDDSFRGGDKRDRFAADAGNDIIDGGGGVDLLRYNRFGVDELQIDLETGIGSVVIDGLSYTHTLRDIEHIRGSLDGEDEILGSNMGERIETFAGKDMLDGRDGGDALFGGKGADTLLGGRGTDQLHGEGGSDDLRGGKGSDRLIDGKGKDLLTGGEGDDTFEFAKSSSKGNQILDFTDTEDMIRIKNGADAFSDLSLKADGGDVILKFAKVAVTIKDTDISDLSADDFLFG